MIKKWASPLDSDAAHVAYLDVNPLAREQWKIIGLGFQGNWKIPKTGNISLWNRQLITYPEKQNWTINESLLYGMYFSYPSL